MKSLELVIPAGNPEKLHTAILYGADAVYIGMEGFSLRARQAEFAPEHIADGVQRAHQYGIKVYAALNIFARNQDLKNLPPALEILNEAGVDAIILSDPGVLRTIRKSGIEIPVHLSTQANTTNVEAVRFWGEQGVRRIVLARELSLDEVAEIAAAVPEMEVELFVHGAMCMAYSGRCFLSAFRTGRSSNYGDCTHPCRWEHVLLEKTRPTEPLILEEDQRYSYLLSSKDLCMIEYLPDIQKAGVTGLKVEGRMKSVYYLAVVTRTYRQALNELQKKPGQFIARPEWLAELGMISNRGYTTGFYFQRESMINEVSPQVKYYQTHDLVGTVLDYEPHAARILVGVRNQLTEEDRLELLLPDATIPLDPGQMTDDNNYKVKSAHNGYRIYFPVHRNVPVGAVIRRQITGSC